MKKLLVSALLLSSVSLYASVALVSKDKDICTANCLASGISILPSVFILDEEVQLTVEDSFFYVLAEIGEDETPITKAIARINKLTIKQVQDLYLSSYGK